MNTMMQHHLAGLERMRALTAYDLDDPHLRQQLDAIAMRTAAQLHRPMAMSTVVLDSAMLIAGSHGIDGWARNGWGGPAEWSFCAQAVLTGEPYIVPDATLDSLQRTNPIVTIDGIRAYAGAPLIAEDGTVVGTHCVLDTAPHEFTKGEIAELRSAADAVMRALEQHPRGGRKPSFFGQ